jgi:glycosyltransferase involved in cell wall biosynthesis
VFLSFGFLHAGKDVETIFRALKDVSGAYLLHGGDQMFRLHLPDSINLVDKYDMQDRTIVNDHYIPEEEKPYYFFAADAIILSYTRQFLSTTSLLWQACRFGTPVIASDNGQLKELVETYQPGLLFSAQNSDSLRESIMRFINLKPEEVEALKDNCHRFASEFSLDSWARKCLEIYDRLMDNRS